MKRSGLVKLCSGARVQTLMALMASVLMAGNPVLAQGVAPTKSAPAKAAPAKPAPVATAVAPVTAPKPSIAQIASRTRPATVADRLLVRTDLPIEPRARIGKLANGMTYVIHPNKTPAGAVSMRLRIEAGGMNEGPNDHGLAHFLEHMAFLGSDHIPEGELVHMLERSGLRFGADTNAFTSATMTYYMLDLPHSDKRSLNTGLFILSETAHSLSLDPETLNREREVVLSEMRTSDTAERRSYRARLESLLDGQVFVDHEVIGTTQSLRAMTAPQLRRFYETWYRPERTTLVITGDVDVAEVQAMINEKFADWKTKQPAPPPLENLAYKRKGFKLDSYSEAGLNPFLSLSWFRPYNESLATRASYRNTLLDAMLIALIERRLGAVDSRFSPYDLVSFDEESYARGATGLTVSMRPKPGQQTYSVTRAYEALRQFATHGDSGVYDLDVADVIAKFNQAYRNEAASEDTRDTPDLANQWVRDINDTAPMMSPGQAYQFWKVLKPQITPAVLKARLNDWLAQDGPFIYSIGDKPTELSDANLKQHWTLAGVMAVSKPSAFVKTPWPYNDFGVGSALVAEETDAVLGVTRLTYANGLKVNIKPTTFKTDEVLVRVRMAGGTNRVSPNDAVPVSFLRFYDRYGILTSGLGELGGGEVEDALIGKNYSLNYDISEGYTDLEGITSSEDILTQAQLMTAFIAKPRFNDYALRQAQAQYASLYRSVENSPENLIGNTWWTYIYPGDTRYSQPTPDVMAKVTGSDFRRLIAFTLKSRPTEVTFVGDVSVAAVKQAVEKTFATLSFGPAEAPNVTEPVPGAQKEIDLTHTGKTGQAAVLVAWPTEGFYPDIRRSRGLRLLGEVMTQRVNSILREREGLAYSPYAYWSGSSAYNQGYLRVMAGINPEQQDRFFTTLSSITEELKAQPVLPDELLRARLPLLESRLTDEKRNEFWLNLVSNASFEPKVIDAYRNYREDMMSFSAGDLQLLARKYLAADQAVTIIARPVPEKPKP